MKSDQSGAGGCAQSSLDTSVSSVKNLLTVRSDHCVHSDSGAEQVTHKEDMSNQNKHIERDKEVTTSLDRSARKKQEWILRKKVSSIAAICGSLKKHKVKKRAPEDNRKKPMRRAGPKESKVTYEESCCRQPGRSRAMCPKCEIVACRRCDTLHANSLFVAHSLLDHYDY